MKKVFLVLAILFLVMICCTPPRSGVKAQLNDAESYINEHPDRALTLLRSIDSLPLRDPALKAHAALLHSIALDNNHIDISSDSIIAPAAWYLKHGTADKKLKTWYYWSILARNAGNADEEMAYLIRGESYIPKANDPVIAGLVYTAKRVLFLDHYDLEDAAIDAELAMKAFKQANVSGLYDNAVIDFANISALQHNYTKASSLLDTLQRHWDKLSYSQKSKYYGIKLAISISSGLRKEYVHFLADQYLQDVPPDSINWEIIAKSYLFLGRVSDALLALDKTPAERSTTEDLAYHKTRYNVLEALGKKKEALEAYNDYSALLDEKTSLGLSLKVGHAKAREYILRDERARKRSFLLLVSGLLLIIGGLFVARALACHKHAANQEAKGPVRLTDNLTEMAKDRLSATNEYGVRVLSGQKLKASIILEKQLSLGDRERFIKNLRETFYGTYPGIAHLFAARRLTTQECDMCILVSMDFNIHEIAGFLALSEKRCYNIRSVAKKKLGVDQDARPLSQIFTGMFS